MVPMSAAGVFPPPAPPAQAPPPLSERIRALADHDIDHLLDELVDDAIRIDTPGNWSATHVASNALDRARSELRIASLSISVQEALR